MVKIPARERTDEFRTLAHQQVKDEQVKDERYIREQRF